MGTSQSGRYINTKGSGRHVSDYAKIHSNEGTFKWSMIRDDGKVKKRIRLKGGGHGEDGIKLLDKYHIEYNIVKTYPNGVRIGNIPNHTDKRKRTGTGQAWFPRSWKEKDIKHAGEHVANLKKNRHVKDGVAVFGNWKGVRVGVIRTNGKISTIFPDKNQPSNKKRRNR